MNKQLTTERFVPLELINPNNSKSVHTDALIDTGADVTVVPAEFAEQLGHATTGGMGMIIQTASGQMTAYSHIFDLVIGDTAIRNKKLIVLPNIKMVLLGWDILATHSIFYSYPLRKLLFGNVIHLISAISSIKEKTILILGQDTSELHRLQRIKDTLAHLGYYGVIVKEIEDIDIQTIEEKVNMLGSISRFIICENSTPSGHVDELKMCSMNRFVTAIIQQDGLGATWMQSDYPMDYSFIKTFSYASIDNIKASVQQAVKWGEEKVRERAEMLNQLYTWRNKP